MPGRFDDVVEAGHGQRDAELLQVAHGAGLDRRNRLVEQHDRRAGAPQRRCIDPQPCLDHLAAFLGRMHVDRRDQSHVRVLGERGDRVAEELGLRRGGAGRVERVAQGAELREEGAESRLRRLGEHREPDPRGIGSVSDQVAGAAGHRDHPEAPGSEWSGVGQQAGGRDELLQGADPDDAELAERGIDQAIVTDQCSGVAPGNLGGELTRTDLESDDRLAQLGRPVCQRAERLASRIDSMNIATERTRSSSTRRAAIVVVSTIDSLPVETTWLTPMFCCAAKAEIVCAVAPLCDTIAIAPGVSSGIRPDQAGTLSRRLMKPRQFGPTQVTPSCTARSVISCCRARPAAPISSKPAASTTAKRIPAAAMSRSASGTASAPTSRRARSTGFPIWVHEVKACCPWTMPPLRFTRCTSPANSSRAKFENEPADQAERSDAPTMTTLRGASNGLSKELPPLTVRSIRVAASR